MPKRHHWGKETNVLHPDNGVSLTDILSIVEERIVACTPLTYDITYCITCASSDAFLVELCIFLIYMYPASNCLTLENFCILRKESEKCKRKEHTYQKKAETLGTPVRQMTSGDFLSWKQCLF
eukprot:Gb_00327 [translate_table: standard]